MKNMTDCFLVCSEHGKAKKALAYLQDEQGFVFCKNIDPPKTKKIMVLGGDGTMLDTMRKYYRHRIPFIGFNCGNVGALMNPLESLHVLDISDSPLNSRFNHFIEISILPLIITVVRKGKSKQFYAYNDVAFETRNGICSGYVKGDVYPKHYFHGNGILFCTALGSSAYSQYAGGSIFPLESNAIGVTSVCSQYSSIRAIERSQKFEVVFSSRYNVHVSVDGRSGGFADSAEMFLSTGSKQVSVLYLPDHDFEVTRHRKPEPPKD